MNVKRPRAKKRVDLLMLAKKAVGREIETMILDEKKQTTATVQTVFERAAKLLRLRKQQMSDLNGDDHVLYEAYFQFESTVCTHRNVTPTFVLETLLARWRRDTSFVCVCLSLGVFAVFVS
jgi:hypothetical protein